MEGQLKCTETMYPVYIVSVWCVVCVCGVCVVCVVCVCVCGVCGVWCVCGQDTQQIQMYYLMNPECMVLKVSHHLLLKQHVWWSSLFLLRPTAGGM